MNGEFRLPPAVDPPEGGLTGLRRRIRRRERRSYAVSGIAVAAVLAFALLLPAPLRQTLDFGAGHPAARVADRSPAEAVRLVGGSAVAWEANTPKTRVYLVSTVTTAPQRPSAAP